METGKLQQRNRVFYLIAEAGDSSGTQRKGNVYCWNPLPENC
jgi:hypothetical protein